MDIESGLSRLENENKKINVTNAFNRFSKLFDNGDFIELDRFAKNGEKHCGVITAYGNVNGIGVYAFSQDSTVYSGAMSRAQSEKIKKVYELALMNGAPIVAVYDSNGAFAEEGIDALNAYGELIKLSSKISGVVPQISVIAGKCIGSAAILAGIADVSVMVKDASFCVNSAAITGNGMVGTADTCAKNGTAGIITDSDIDAMNVVSKLISMLPSNNLSVAAVTEYVPSTNVGEGVYSTISSFVDADSFIELYKDFGCCGKVGFARICGNSVGVVTMDSSVNDGKLCGNGSAKISRFVRLCDAFSIPIVTFLDCKGFMGKADDELDGSVKSVASLTAAYAEATTVKITVITGSAYGAAFTCFAGKASGIDYCISYADAEICPLEPKTAVQFIYNERLGTEKREDLEKEYILTEGSPFKAAQNGNVDSIVTADKALGELIGALYMLNSKRVSTLDKKHSNMPF